MPNQQINDSVPFHRWMDELDFDTASAAAILGKSKRIVEMYERGRLPPVSTRKLMTAIFHLKGRNIAPWPSK